MPPTYHLLGEPETTIGTSSSIFFPHAFTHAAAAEGCDKYLKYISRSRGPTWRIIPGRTDTWFITMVIVSPLSGVPKWGWIRPINRL